MKILFAEAAFLQNPDEQLDFSAVSKAGDLHLADIISADDLAGSMPDAEILVVGRQPVSRSCMQTFPKLRAIVKSGTGVDRIDVAAARDLGITVMNLSGYGAEPVAQGAMAFILALAGSLPQYDHAVKHSNWAGSRFAFPVTLLKGKTLGIIGLGSISRRVIEMANSFDMNVLVSTGYPDPELDLEYVELGAIADHSDFISIHCALNDRTRGIVDAAFLSRVKKTAYLINTARAAVIEERAIVEALREKRIAGLAMDVFWVEPPPHHHELFDFTNVILTPHMSWSPFEIRQRMLDEIGGLIGDFSLGRPRNVVR